jgi:hypothetical protein
MVQFYFRYSFIIYVLIKESIMKKNFQTQIISLFFTCLLLFGGCSKKSASTSKKSNTEYLTNSAWLIKSYQEDVGIDGTIDYTDDPSSCQQDDTYTFATNNILTYNPEAVTCDSTDVISTTTWALTEKDTVLTFSGYSYYIKSLNDTLLSLYYDTASSGTNLRIYYNFKH